MLAAPSGASFAVMVAGWKERSRWPSALVAVAAAAALGVASVSDAPSATRPPAKLTGTLASYVDDAIFDAKGWRQQFVWRREARVVFTYVRTRGGVAKYRLKSGTMTVSTTGTLIDGGIVQCTLAGSWSGPLDPARSSLDYWLVPARYTPRGTFVASVSARASDGFEARKICDGEEAASEEYEAGKLEVSGRSPSLTKLKGTQSERTDKEGWQATRKYTWDLKPGR
jgi:hypothetical protein